MAPGGALINGAVHARPVASANRRVFASPMQAEQSIVIDPKSPGGINSPHGLILFGGVCVLPEFGSFMAIVNRAEIA
jgi:hypothetical protein